MSIASRPIWSIVSGWAMSILRLGSGSPFAGTLRSSPASPAARLVRHGSSG
jgi:hypothetical protein